MAVIGQAVIGQYESFLTLLILILVAAYLVRRNDQKNKAVKSLVELLNDFNFELQRSGIAIRAFIDNDENAIWFGKQDGNEIVELLPTIACNKGYIIVALTGKLENGILYHRNEEGVVVHILKHLAKFSEDFAGYKPAPAETE